MESFCNAHCEPDNFDLTAVFNPKYLSAPPVMIQVLEMCNYEKHGRLDVDLGLRVDHETKICNPSGEVIGNVDVIGDKSQVAVYKISVTTPTAPTNAFPFVSMAKDDSTSSFNLVEAGKYGLLAQEGDSFLDIARKNGKLRCVVSMILGRSMDLASNLSALAESNLAISMNLVISQEMLRAQVQTAPLLFQATLRSVKNLIQSMSSAALQVGV